MSEMTPEERLAETEHWWAAKIWMVHSNMQIVGRRGTEDVRWLISRVRELEEALEASRKSTLEWVGVAARDAIEIGELEADRHRLQEQLADALDPVRKLERQLNATANNWETLPCGHRGMVCLIEDTEGRYCKSVCDICGADAAMNAESKEGK